MQVRNLLGILGYPLRGLRLIKSLATQDGFVHILIYHDIPPSLFSYFAQQIKMAAKEYTFITPEMFELMMAGKLPIKGANLLLTFDDGFKSNRVVAEEILEPFGIRAIFFIVTDFIAVSDRQHEKQMIANQIHDRQISVNEVSDTMRAMTWDDLHFLISRGHAIGSHTCSHARLSMISDSVELQREIIDSKNVLQSTLGVPVDYFAYPFGDINSINADALGIARNNYRFVFSAIRGANRALTHPAAMRREAVSLHISLPYFRLMLEGGLSPLYTSRRQLLDSFVVD